MVHELGPKIEAHILHISEGSYNKHIKKDCVNPEEPFYQNSRNPVVGRPKRAHKIQPLGSNYHTPTQVVPMSL